jgi:hypothetical protein
VAPHYPELRQAVLTDSRVLEQEHKPMRTLKGITLRQTVQQSQALNRMIHKLLQDQRPKQQLSLRMETRAEMQWLALNPATKMELP